MAFHKLTRSQRLMAIIVISFSFFVAELSIGFKTRSLALVADAFHYMNDLIGFIVALVAVKVSEQPQTPRNLAFGWQRSQLLGAFFNGVFLLALGVSILLQSIERFVALQHVENPKLVLIVGCIGLTLNIISASFLHEHEHEPPATGAFEDDNRNALRRLSGTHVGHRHPSISRPKKNDHDLGVLGVLIHVIGDAINNVGVIISALVIWLAKYPGRFYADPGVSTGIAFMILASAVPLVKNSGSILLESVPLGVNLEDIRHDLESIPGVASVHELHAWRLNQSKAIASAHIVTNDSSLSHFMAQAERIGECLHAYGIHSVTLQPELVDGTGGDRVPVAQNETPGLRARRGADAGAEARTNFYRVSVVQKRCTASRTLRRA
ncbi:hypothetical protein LTR47_010856 [Exophiala xenobiotica]|nr:hypothetical protein LTR92_011103 [Exophiala xenobiotica]KAK5221567.1 hypothetical protein LTR47_010856 [Exophiala xenobiotica]KAK5285110.1 hypothetical protein LTR14_011224 [Exophiala xenobiotica]KAK5356105.1 hypothetical protein LTS03_011767 [Exophiala xenobiotica]KAK5405170.1 hypothetical protein LTR90_011016 [Exophiala xenobiotica]